MGVLLACNNNSVDVRLPESFDDHAGITVFVERVTVDLAEGSKELWLVFLCLLDHINYNLLAASRSSHLLHASNTTLLFNLNSCCLTDFGCLLCRSLLVHLLHLERIYFC